MPHSNSLHWFSISDRMQWIVINDQFSETCKVEQATSNKHTTNYKSAESNQANVKNIAHQTLRWHPKKKRKWQKILRPTFGIPMCVFIRSSTSGDSGCRSTTTTDSSSSSSSSSNIDPRVIISDGNIRPSGNSCCWRLSSRHGRWQSSRIDWSSRFHRLLPGRVGLLGNESGLESWKFHYSETIAMRTGTATATTTESSPVDGLLDQSVRYFERNWKGQAGNNRFTEVTEIA